MTKGEAREAVSKIILESKREISNVIGFGEFIETVYFPYYSRKWKDSTPENNMNRIAVHLVAALKDRELAPRLGESRLGRTVHEFHQKPLFSHAMILAMRLVAYERDCLGKRVPLLLLDCSNPAYLAEIAEV